MAAMRIFPLIPAALVAAPVAAQAPIVHVNGWARATVPGQSASAAYLSIHNGGGRADRLLSVQSSVAGQTSIHSTTMAGGVMRMRPAGALTIGPNQMLEMKPGGLHVMLMKLKGPLKAGQRIPLVLRFERAGIVRTSVPVQSPPR